ncbi:hypothetical protein HDU93_005479, partial [Gonapodya sp. JEL0774]
MSVKRGFWESGGNENMLVDEVVEEDSVTGKGTGTSPLGIGTPVVTRKQSRRTGRRVLRFPNGEKVDKDIEHLLR